jgi:hypothetical protein
MASAAEIVNLIKESLPADGGIDFIQDIRAGIFALSSLHAQPIDFVRWVPIEDVEANDYNPNSVAAKEMGLLYTSIKHDGYTQPIVTIFDAERQKYVIIDGFHRWICAQSDKRVLKRDKKTVPVIFKDVDAIDAMVMHICLNRGRGQIVAKYMSSIVKDVYHSGKYSPDEIKDIFNMSYAELTLMMDSSVIKQRKITEYSYSKAWVPIEAPQGSAEEIIELEKPPNADR